MTWTTQVTAQRPGASLASLALYCKYCFVKHCFEQVIILFMNIFLHSFISSQTQVASILINARSATCRCYEQAARIASEAWASKQCCSPWYEFWSDSLRRQRDLFSIYVFSIRRRLSRLLFSHLLILSKLDPTTAVLLLPVQQLHLLCVRAEVLLQARTGTTGTYE